MAGTALLRIIKYIIDKYGNSKVFKPLVIIPNSASFKGKSGIGDKINTQIIQQLIDAIRERCTVFRLLSLFMWRENA